MTTKQFTSATIIIVVISVFEVLGAGPMTNGATHAGIIQVGGLDTWTFTAVENDSITISIGEVSASVPDPLFTPWIRLRRPDGAPLGDSQSANAAQIDVRAPLTGTYTILVASPLFSYSGNNQIAPGNYVLSLAGANSSVAKFLCPCRDGNNLTLSWTGTGTLQQADSVTGPWSNATSQRNPQTVTIMGTARFYRLR